MNPRLRLWWCGSLIAKFILAAVLPLSLDENYYWVWSKNLQLSYFDHPGMVAWLYKLGHFLEPLGSAVRWPGVLLGHLTLLVWIFILKRWLAADKIFIWFLLALFSPLIGLGSLILTPDLPVVFFWSLSLLFFQRLLENQNFRNALALGICLGLGFCSKYHIVLFVPCALALVVFERKWRILRPATLASVFLSGILFSLPVLIWNYKNDFSSFVFQLNHGLTRPSWNPFWTYSYLIGQILLLFPIPVWLAFRARLNASERFLVYFSWGPLLFFFLSSFKALVEMNWPIVAYHSFYAISVLGAQTTRALRWTVRIWGVLSFLIISLVALKLYPQMPGKLQEFSVFRPTLKAKEKYEPLFAENYQMASYIWFQTKSPTYKLHLMSRRDFFDQLEQSRPKESTFYVVMNKNASLPEWVEKQGFISHIQEELETPFVVIRVERK